MPEHRRDLDLIRSMLLSWITEGTIRVEGYSEELISQHGELMIEAGLMEGHVSSTHGQPSAIFPERITWRGHDFLDATEDPAIWKSVTTQVREKLGATSMAVMLTLASELAKEKLGIK